MCTDQCYSAVLALTSVTGRCLHWPPLLDSACTDQCYWAVRALMSVTGQCMHWSALLGICLFNGLLCSFSRRSNTATVAEWASIWAWWARCTQMTSFRIYSIVAENALCLVTLARPWTWFDCTQWMTFCRCRKLRGRSNSRQMMRKGRMPWKQVQVPIFSEALFQDTTFPEITLYCYIFLSFS